MNAGPERTLLAGGYRNQVWKVRGGRGWVIEKRYAEDPGEPNPMYPNLPDHEAAALGLLGPHGWSPRLVSHEPGVVTYQFVAGRGWRARGRDGGVAEVAELLGSIHALPAPRAMRVLCGSAAEACVHGDAMVDAVPVRAAAALRAVRPADPGDRPVRRRSLVHTDCGPGNLVRGRRAAADRLAVPRPRRRGGGHRLLPVAGDDDALPAAAAHTGRARCVPRGIPRSRGRRSLPQRRARVALPDRCVLRVARAPPGPPSAGDRRALPPRSRRRGRVHRGPRA